MTKVRQLAKQMQGLSPSKHVRGNPTVRKHFCPEHEDVVISRDKLRTKPVVSPCWRCQQIRLETELKAAQERIQILTCALGSEKERTILAERRATFLEETQDGLHKQTAKLVSQVAAISEELASGLQQRKLVEDELHEVRARLDDAQRQLRVNSSGLPSSVLRSLPTSADLISQSEGGQAGPRRPQSPASLTTSIGSKFAKPLASSVAASLFSRNSHLQSPPADHAQASLSSSQTVPSQSFAAAHHAGLPGASSDHSGAESLPTPHSPLSLTRPALVALEPEHAERQTNTPSGQVWREDEESEKSDSTEPLVILAGQQSTLLQDRTPVPGALKSENSQGHVSEVNAPATSDKDGRKFLRLLPRIRKRPNDQGQADRVASCPRKSFLAKISSKEPAEIMSTDKLLYEVDRPLPIDALASKLLYLLETDRLALLRVYRRAEQLEEWRIEVQMDLHIRSQVQKRAEENVQAHHTAEAQSLSRGRSTVFEDDLELVTSLMSRIKEAVRQIIRDCFLLAQDKAELLRQTVEVVRLHEIFQEKKLSGARQKIAENGESLETVLRLCGIEDWNAELRRAFKEATAFHVLEIFSIAHIQAAEGQGGTSEGLNRERAMLHACRGLLMDLRANLSLLPPFFAPEHRATQILLGQYDAHISRQIQVLHEHGLADLQIGDLFEITRFLTSYQQEILDLGLQRSRPELRAAANQCFQECLIKTRQQMTEWYATILSRKPELIFDDRGQPVTSTPEDLFQIINTHVQVGVEAGRFEGDELCHLLVVMLNVLKAFIADMYDNLHTSCLSESMLEVSMLCARVNDCDRLQDKIVELRDNLLLQDKLQQEPHFAILEEVIDQFNDEQTRLSFEATRLIAFQVLRDASATLLQRSPFDDPSQPLVQTSAPPFQASQNTNLTTSGHASASFSALLSTAPPRQPDHLAEIDGVKDARLTLKDYFADLHVWIPGYFFSHVVSICFTSIINLYVVSLLRGRHIFRDTEEVTHHMRQDKQVLLADFEPYQRQLGETGIKEMRRSFVPFDDLMDVIQKGTEMGRPWTDHFLRSLPSPWNVDALLQVRASRGESMERREREEERIRFVQGYAQDERARDRLVERCLAWKILSCPLVGACWDTVKLVRECVWS